MTARYAIYFAPSRDSALWQAGCRWLGRDPECATPLDPPAIAHCSVEQWEAATASPRRYGFHATLKAPFALAAGRTASELAEALSAFAGRQRRFSLPPLEVAELGEFLALRPCGWSVPLAELAAACVTQFDAFRRPPHADETARRLAAHLTAGQRALLERWGYPYVLDEYRFHLTLTDRLQADTRGAMKAWLTAHLRMALESPVVVDQIALFTEAVPGDAFALVRRFAFADARE